MFGGNLSIHKLCLQKAFPNLRINFGFWPINALKHLRSCLQFTVVWHLSKPANSSPFHSISLAVRTGIMVGCLSSHFNFICNCYQCCSNCCVWVNWQNKLLAWTAIYLMLCSSNCCLWISGKELPIICQTSCWSFFCANLQVHAVEFKFAFQFAYL